ncbi:MAG: hypothetical protein CSA13_01610 [Clostridiales bacterium]|nr:MAG: hypothetical protein CSA13_01610 [Clostridiales bacterium]
MINLDKYRVFYLAAKYQNFTKTAKKLYTSQSNVSQIISSLERELALKLFNRNGRYLSLSNDGKILFEEVKLALNHFDNVARLAQNIKDINYGSISIGASDTICRHYLIDYLKAFRNKYPNITIALINKPSPRIKEMVIKGEIDIGFVNSTPIREKDLTIDVIEDIEEVFFCAKRIYDHLSAQPSLKELAKFPLVCLNKNTFTRMLLDDLFEANQLSLIADTEVISIDLMVDLVAADFGIGFTHKKIIEKSNLYIIDILEAIPKRQLLLMHNKKRGLSHAAKAFVSFFS